MKITRILTALLLVFCMSFCSVGAMAADKAPEEGTTQKYHTGLKVEKWEDMISGKENDFVKFWSERRRYDVNSDGIITAADARLCLRIAAGLEPANHIEHVAATGEYDRNAKAADARNILRIAAKLNKGDEPTRLEASYEHAWGVIVGPLNNIEGYTWKHDADSKLFECNELAITDKDAQNTDRACTGQYFFFKPLVKEGSYTISFKLSDSSGKEVKDSFTVVITVK